MVNSINGLNYAGTNAVSFGQGAVAAQGQYTTNPYQNDSFTASKQPAKEEEEKGSFLKKAIITAAVVLGGAAAAKKWLPMVRDFDKALLSADKVKLTDRAIGAVSTLGEKVLGGLGKLKGLFSKTDDVAENVAKKEVKIKSFGLTEKGKARAELRKAQDAYKNISAHNPKSVINLGNGKTSLPIGLPTPEQVEATISKMAKK